MFQLTKYASAKEPKVQEQASLTEVLQIIKEGDSNLPLITFARTMVKGSLKYDKFKKSMLPTFRFNFLFKESASNNNITKPTGLIYLDADNLDEIPDNPYVLAKWKSLSDTGFGILVKVDNLTLENYTETYDQLSEVIGVSTDNGARKATQQTIQSYDPNLYHNPDSLVFHSTENKKVSSAPIKEKREKGIGTNETFPNRNEKPIRFNNIGDYFQDEFTDAEYRIFNVKIRICNPFIPMTIEQGKRNTTMFFLMSQYSLLNDRAGKPILRALADSVNRKMYPKLSDKEIDSVIKSVLKKRTEETLELYCNQERRILFNPAISMTAEQKRKIVNTELGKMKSDHTQESIYLLFDEWDFEADGKITQKKVAAKSGLSESTVKRHWKSFKEHVRTLNADWLKFVTNARIAETTPLSVETEQNGITIEKYISNLKCKYAIMQPSDEKFLETSFQKQGIHYVNDSGFKEIHQFMTEILKSRKMVYNVA